MEARRYARVRRRPPASLTNGPSRKNSASADAKEHMQTTRYLIVGGGMTADAAAKGIREHDADGAIVLVGDEPHEPYKRPPLTKGLWSGGDEAKVWKNTAELNVELQ